MATAALKLSSFLALTVLSAGCSVEKLGRNIPQDDLTSDYLKALLWALILGGGVALLPVRSGDRRLLLKYWGAKVTVALGLMLFYEYSYGLDAYYYFAMSQGPFEWRGIEFGNGTGTMVQLAWLHDHLVPDSYHAMKVSCAFVGMLAVYLFYRAAVLYVGRELPRLFWALALYPSVLFWSTILGKDPIVLLGIALYVHGVLTWARGGRSVGLLWGAAGLLLAMLIRTWMGPILLAPLSIFVLSRARSMALKAVLVAIAAGGFLLALDSVLARFSVETSEDLFMTTNTISRSWARGGSGQQIDAEFNSIGSMLTFMPLGVVAALFRPFPFEVLSPFGLIAGFENALLLYLLWKAFRGGAWRQAFGDPVFRWVVLTVFVWAVVYGFVSYQNLGSAVRFRLQVLPLMLCVLLYLGAGRSSVRVEARAGSGQRRLERRLTREPRG